MALSHHSLLHGEVPYGEVHLQGPFEGLLGVRVSLYMDGLRAADPQGSGGHQDVPASRQTQEHAVGGGTQVGEAAAERQGHIQGITQAAAECPPFPRLTVAQHGQEGSPRGVESTPRARASPWRWGGDVQPQATDTCTLVCSVCLGLSWLS